MALNIDDLLNALQHPEDHRDTSGVSWDRIAKRDKFEELGLEKSELDNFLSTWIEDNPYNDI